MLNLSQANQFYLDFPMFFYLCTIIFCLIIGSFLNVLIYRIPIIIFSEWTSECNNFLKIKTKKSKDLKNSKHIDETNISLFYPARSHCPHCKKSILFKDNIPILSFIFLKAKCRSCKAKISYRYPFIELLTAIVGCLIIYKLGITYFSVSLLFLSFLLILISAIDYDHMIIPDYLTYIGLWIGLLLNPSTLAIYGSVFGYLLLWTIYWVFKLLTGKEGFGHGDFKLNALFGAWLGPYNLLPMLILACFSGIITTVIKHLLKLGELNKPFPFGPHLVLAGWIMLMYRFELDYYIFDNLFNFPLFFNNF